MTPDRAFRRASSRPPKVSVGVKLRSDDNPMQRAANLMSMAGIDQGDPRDLDQIQRELARGIASYQAVDAEARRK
jgi:hypothetical protein